MPTITFLQAANNINLSKEFSTEGKKSYPISVKNFTSYEYVVTSDLTGWEEKFDYMKAHAKEKHCMLKGELDRRLVNEPRKGHTDRYRKTDTLVLDIDGLELNDYVIPRIIEKDDLKEMAEKVVELLPIEFTNTTYIATASSSLGQKGNKVCLHLDFHLKNKVDPVIMKDWLAKLNIETETFSKAVKLNPSGLSLAYPIDRTLAQNDKLIYIAPPIFNNPLKDPVKERIILIKKEKSVVNLIPMCNKEALNQLIQKKVTQERGLLGLRKRTAKIRTITTKQGYKQDVLDNPDKARISYAYHNDKFCYFNINDGDSNSYWCPLDDPRIIYTFKDEQPFEMEKVDPKFYDWYLEKFQIGRVDYYPFVFRDFWTDIHYNALANVDEDKIIRIASANKNNLNDFMEENGMAMPDPVPTWDYEFVPTTKRQIDFQKQWINKYQPTEYFINVQKQKTTYTYGDAIELRNYCPTIYKILWHMVGNGTLEFEHFINWLAFAIQTKEKTGTAWVFSGVEGTGKGVFYHKILAPLMGHRYTVMRKLVDFDDQFNAWMETNLFCIVDETSIDDTPSSKRTMNFLKNFITEPYGKVRRMRIDMIQDKPLFNNVMFFTNDQSALNISRTDRRFNVAPEQTKALIADSPKIRGEIKNSIDKELQLFCNFLISFQVDQEQAFSSLDNSAKAAMREASITWIEEFCSSLITGKLDFFIQFLDGEPSSLIQEATLFQATQRFIKSWIADVDIRSSFIPNDRLRTIYMYLNNTTIAKAKFGKLLSRNGVKISKQRVSGLRHAVRGVEVTWKLEDYEKTELIDHLFTEKDKGAYTWKPTTLN